MSPCQTDSRDHHPEQRNLDQVQRRQQGIQMRVDQPAQENNYETRNDQSKHDKKRVRSFIQIPPDPVSVFIIAQGGGAHNRKQRKMQIYAHLPP